MTLLQLVFYTGLLLSILIFCIGNKMSLKSFNAVFKKALLQAIGLTGIICYAVVIIFYLCQQINWSYKVF
jgi:uncharacterized MnhB-related membrane protein